MYGESAGADPSGQSKRKIWRFTAHFAHIATLTQHTPLHEALLACSPNIKHSNLQLPRDSSVAVPKIQWLILRGRGFEKWPYNESFELHSSCHKFCVVNGGLRLPQKHSHMVKIFQCPQTPLEHCALQLWAICAPHHPPLCTYAPSSSISGSTPEALLLRTNQWQVNEAKYLPSTKWPTVTRNFTMVKLAAI